MSNLAIRNIPEFVLASSYNVLIYGGKLIGTVYMMPHALRFVVSRPDDTNIKRFELFYDDMVRVFKLERNELVIELKTKPPYLTDEEDKPSGDSTNGRIENKPTEEELYHDEYDSNDLDMKFPLYYERQFYANKLNLLINLVRR